MGNALSWLALKTERLPDLLKPFDLQPAQGVVDHEDSDFAAASLPSGWKLLWANQYEPPEFGPALLGSLSMQGELMVVHVEEQAMCASAALWHQGKQVWRIAHDAQIAAGHLDADGNMPEPFQALRQQQMQQQLEADAVGESVDHIFEVPIELAKIITGFRYDETEGVAFELLNSDASAPPAADEQNQAAPTKPWWKIW